MESGTLAPYRDALEHLSDELEWLRCRIQAAVASGSVSAGAAETNLAGPPIGGDQGVAAAVTSRQLGALLPDHQRDWIDERIGKTRRSGLQLPLAQLGEAFGLSRLEREILLLLLAWALEPDLRALLRWFGGDPAQRRLDVGLLAALLTSGLAGRDEVMACVSAGRPLRERRLILVDERDEEGELELIDMRMRVHPQVARYALRGSGCDLDETIRSFTRLVRPGSVAAGWIVDERERERLTGLFERAREQSGRLRLVGPAGVGKKLFVRTMVRDAPLLLVDVPRWLVGALHQSSLFAETLNTLLVEATLRDALLYLDTRSDEQLEPALAARLEQALSSFAGLCVVAGHRRSLDSIDASDATTEITLAVPEMASRAQLWRRALAAEDGARAIDCAELASQFALTGGQIEAAVGWAIAQHGGELSTEALRDGARRQVSSTLATLAERVEENSRWEDVVLPAELRQALDELRAFAVQRRAVFDDWGFGRRFSSGRGLTALFHGPPGTGKTMVAAILARELGLELFRIDLSRVVSKWVGETEKNLARVFDAAEHAQALLLFDEADSLFSTRTEVRSANDRYGNLEVNYLLQRMEQFDGTTILTTNHSTVIDKAFQRRLRFRLHFPAPDEEARLALWQKMLPPEAPLEGPIAWQKLAAGYDLSGGHIKNAVLRAAFRAADRKDAIRMSDLQQAAIVECRETGRLVKAEGRDGRAQQVPRR